MYLQSNCLSLDWAPSQTGLSSFRDTFSIAPLTKRQLLTNSSLVSIPSWLVSNLLKVFSTLSLSCLALISMHVREEGCIQDMAMISMMMLVMMIFSPVISTLMESLLLGR